MEDLKKNGRPTAMQEDSARLTLTAWRGWRSKNKGILSTVLKDPKGFDLYKAMVQFNSKSPTVLTSYTEWLQATLHTQNWVIWKRQHSGPLCEVLKDPEGWELFRLMKIEKNLPVPLSYDAWVGLPEQEIGIRKAAWTKWYCEHPGPLLNVLKDPKGWELYYALRLSRDENIPSTLEDFIKMPHTRKEAAEESWTCWRRINQTSLTKALAHPMGFSMFQELMEVNGHPVEATYEEWLAKRSQPMTWKSWRRRNRGPLYEVLAKPEAWNYYQSMRDCLGIELPPTFEEWIQLPTQLISIATSNWITWRCKHPGALHKVLKDVEGWALYKKLKRLEGETIPDTYENWITSRKLPALEAWRLWKQDRNEPLIELLKDPEGWKLYKAAEKRRHRHMPETYEEFSQADACAHAWYNWVAQNPGPLTSVLKDSEGWKLFSAYKETKGETVPSTFTEWVAQPAQKSLVVAGAWMEWWKAHPGALVEVLKSSEGWSLYKAFVLSVGASIPETYERWAPQALHYAEVAFAHWKKSMRGQSLRSLLRHGEGFGLFQAYRDCSNALVPLSYGEWENCHAKVLQWKVWRHEHPGSLMNVLKDPEGWALYANFQEVQSTTKLTSYEEWVSSPEQKKAHATEQWIEWRKVNKGAVSEVLQTQEGWEMYKAMKKATGNFQFDSYKEWAQAGDPHAMAMRDWRFWRKTHAGTLSEVLSDPEGWKNYRAAYSNQRRQLPETYEKFLERKRIGRAWNVWRREHSGPLHEVLTDAEGWRLYREVMVNDGEDVPLLVGDWLLSPRGKVVLQIAEWTAWRRCHKGLLSDVLVDAEGWRLYKVFMKHQGKEVPENYSEWAKSTDAHEPSMGAKEFWKEWRKRHAGPLKEVLADAKGWALFAAAGKRNGRKLPATYKEWVSLGCAN